MNLPHLPWYSRDWLADTAHLSYEAKGIYFDILNYMWIRDDCQMPDDAAFVAALLKLPVKRWEQVRAILVDGPAPVLRVSGGFLYNKRLLAERTKALIKIGKRKAAADTRWGNEPGANALQIEHEDTENGDAHAMQMHSKSNANGGIRARVPEPEPESELTSSTAPTRARTREAVPEPGTTVTRPVPKVPAEMPEQYREQHRLRTLLFEAAASLMTKGVLTKAHKGRLDGWLAQYKAHVSEELILYATEETAGHTGGDALNYLLEVMRREIEEPEKRKAKGGKQNGHSGAANGRRGRYPDRNDRANQALDEHIWVHQIISDSGDDLAEPPRRLPKPA